MMERITQTQNGQYNQLKKSNFKFSNSQIPAFIVSVNIRSYVIDFPILSTQRLLAGNGFIVGCHVASKFEVANESARF